MRKLFGVSLTILALAALPKPAAASEIVGTLQIAGGASIIDLGGGQTLIDFGSSAGCPAVPGGSGCLDIQDIGTTGFFADLDDEFDIILDLSSITAPVTGFDPIQNFQGITNTSVNFVLEDILSCPELGAFVVCPGGATSAFGFAQVGVGEAVQTTVTMVMTGIVFDEQGIVSDWEGVFTAQFAGQTIAEVLADFAADGQIDASISGTKVSILREVPEPATLALLGLALIGGGVRARRRRQ